MQRLLFLVFVALPGPVAGCAGERADADAAVGADTLSGGDSAASSADGIIAPGGALDTATDRHKAMFTLGTNTTGKATPDQFKALPAGSYLNVELGPQGLWMVVLAFKTKNLLKPPLVLGASVEMAGQLLGELKLGKQKLLPGPSGFFYYYNFFLVVAPEGVAGKSAVIHFSVDQKDGNKVKLAHEVVLVGGK